MNKGTIHDADRERLVEAVRDYCLQELAASWEQAGISGLCGDGRWEVALGRVGSLSSAEILAALPG